MKIREQRLQGILDNLTEACMQCDSRQAVIELDDIRYIRKTFKKEQASKQPKYFVIGEKELNEDIVRELITSAFKSTKKEHKDFNSPLNASFVKRLSGNIIGRLAKTS